jgi:fructose-bisphosphate aldolase class I
VACHEAGIVAIVEPEMLMIGSQPMHRCAQVTVDVHVTVVAELVSCRLDLPGIVLKPMMVAEGAGHPKRSTPRQSAAATGRRDAALPPQQAGVDTATSWQLGG